MARTEPPLGRAVSAIQEAFDVDAYEMADMLGIERREMSLIMLDKAAMREVTREKFHEVFGIDVFMAACCLTADADKMPELLRNPAAALYASWDQTLAGAVERFKAARA